MVRNLIPSITKQAWFWIVALLPCLISVLYLCCGWNDIFITNSLFTCLLLVLSVIDCEKLILPDILTLPGTLLAILCAIFINELAWELSLAGAVVGWAWFYAMAKLNPHLLGLGDSKLMLLVGGYLGFNALFPLILLTTFFLGLYWASGFSIIRVNDKSHDLDTQIKPFAPFLCSSAYLYILLKGVMI